MDVCPTNHEPKATAWRVSACGKEAGAQNADLTNRNHVARHGVRGKLATDSKAQTGLKQRHVNVAGIAGKLSYLIRGGLTPVFLSQKSAEAVVVDGVTTIQGDWRKPVTGRRAERGQELRRRKFDDD